MVADGKYIGPLESGVYLIQSLAARSPLNLVCPKEGQKPVVCHWKTFKSPTERWVVERGEQGYRFQNASTSLYMAVEGDKPKTDDPALGLRKTVEWVVEEDSSNSLYYIKLASTPSLLLDVLSPWFSNGIQVVVRDGMRVNFSQQWTFVKLSDELPPPPFTKQVFIGPVPPGLYWLGQPYEAHQSYGKSIPMGQAPSTSALGATACEGLEEGNLARVHLSAVGDVPWPHQIWALEPGRRGYRLRNVAINAYLNYLQSEPVLESISDGPASISEWSLARDSESSASDAVDWLIRPCADYNVILGITKGENFNKLLARTSQAWSKKKKEGVMYRRWRFEPLEERALRILSRFLMPEELQIAS
ncbi:hypothetical protein FRC03_000818 [Tulasnella sp. 419]|nr:hypothetical protein FRC03_000818 [Tulasnella sp. 419]